jgi:hypothetical protein
MAEPAELIESVLGPATSWLAALEELAAQGWLLTPRTLEDLADVKKRLDAVTGLSQVGKTLEPQEMLAYLAEWLARGSRGWMDRVETLWYANWIGAGRGLAEVEAVKKRVEGLLNAQQ